MPRLIFLKVMRMGIVDDLKEKARRSLNPTREERKADRKERLASYRNRATELRSETRYLKAKKERDKYDTGGLSGMNLFAPSGGGSRSRRGESSDGFGFSNTFNDAGFDFGIGGGPSRSRRRSEPRRKKGRKIVIYG